MKFGLFGGAIQGRGETIDSQGYQSFIERIIEADQLGFEGIFMVEHHFSGVGQVSATLNMISYLAARTERIRLGTAVTVLPWHNPVILAEEAATADLLSGGRLEFGVGKGYRDIEFKGFKIDKAEAQERYNETLEIIIKAWTSNERFSYEGKWWSYEDIAVEPAPIQKPHPPLWTGAGTPESITRVAKAGMSLLLDQFGNLDLTETRINAFRDGCKEIGRAFNPMEIGLTRTVLVTENDAETEAIIEARSKGGGLDKFGPLPGLPSDPDSYADGGRMMKGAAIIGTPDEVIPALKGLEAIGVGYVLALATPNVKSMRLLAAEVMPAMQSEAAAAE